MIFQATINIHPITWKHEASNPRSNYRRYMLPAQRQYYYQLYEALREAGLTPLAPAPVEFSLVVVYHFKERMWRDTTNLTKASKWACKKDKPFMPDFWDDKQFADIHAIRVRGSDRYCIEIEIKEWKGYEEPA